MELNDKFYILCENESDSNNIQKILFKLGYSWYSQGVDDFVRIIDFNNFPIYICNFDDDYDSRVGMNNIKLLWSDIYSLNPVYGSKRYIASHLIRKLKLNNL